MKKVRDIVMIGSEERWELEGIRPRGASLARAFGRSENVGKVLLVNHPRSVPNRVRAFLKGEKGVESLYPVVLRKNGLTVFKIHPKLFMVNATVTFPETAGFLAEMDRKTWVKNLNALIRELGFVDPGLWILNPRVVDVAKDLGAGVRIFDTIDNLLVHPQTRMFRKKIQEAYAWVETNADLICLLSDSQRPMFSASPKLFVLPNGVEEIFFKTPETRPADLDAIGKPMVMYVGVLQEKVDAGLVDEVASRLPDHQFVFIGPEVAPRHFDGLKRRSNVHFLGTRSYDQIPSYLACADVCMIPHQVDALTRFMDPLKIYEYLACGRPIVSTPVSGTEKFEKHIYVARGAEPFAAAIRIAITENNRALEEERRRAASAHSWDIRASQVLAKMDEGSKDKAGRAGK